MGLINILQISDTHLLKDPSGELWGTKPYPNFSKIIKHIKNNFFRPDLVLLTGDLSQDSTPESYQHLVNTLAGFSAKIYFVPGNHDVLTVMQQVFQNSSILFDKLIYLNSWAIILLNSVAIGKVSGVLSPQELTFLESSLEKTRHLKTIVALHHHPVTIQSQLMDQYILENREEFLKIIYNKPQVKIVLFGHVHQVFETCINKIAFLSCASSFAQFPTGAANFVIDPLPPAYRWLQLTEKSFSTGIFRLPFKV
jgi:Icc protein